MTLYSSESRGVGQTSFCIILYKYVSLKDAKRAANNCAFCGTRAASLQGWGFPSCKVVNVTLFNTHYFTSDKHTEIRIAIRSSNVDTFCSKIGVAARDAER
jgi:hypothetical protein